MGRWVAQGQNQVKQNNQKKIMASNISIGKRIAESWKENMNYKSLFPLTGGEEEATPYKTIQPNKIRGGRFLITTTSLWCYRFKVMNLEP